MVRLPPWALPLRDHTPSPLGCWGWLREYRYPPIRPNTPMNNITTR